MKLNTPLITAALTAVLALSTPAKAVPVDLELILLADVSGSVDATDFALQRDGYEAAFRSASVISAIQSGTLGSIAATLVYWSSSSQQSQVVGWSQINDSTTSNAFADAISTAIRPFSGGTSVTGALNFAAGLISADNGFEGSRIVIDVSGDGDEGGTGPGMARDAAIAAGADVINAIWIEDPPFFCVSGCSSNPITFGANNVIAGTGSFQTVVSNFMQFAPAVESKITTEITGGGTPSIPEPGTLALFGLGLAGLGLARRRKVA